MATMIEEILNAWRNGERVLATLPATDPDRPEVAEAVAVLRLVYKRMTDGENVARAKVEAGEQAIDRSLAVIERALERIGRSPLATDDR